MSYLNDDEHRILLAALRREKEFCSRQLTDSKRCVAIVQSLERKFQYDRFEKEIRDKVIDELKDKICSHFADWQYSEDDKWIKDIIELASEGVEEIAEQMKEVGE